MIALSQPIVELIFGGGRFTPADVHLTAWFFAFYALSLLAWSAQAIYARAFYAAGNTFFPMIASTVISSRFPSITDLVQNVGSRGPGARVRRRYPTAGRHSRLLLHKRRMVSLASLDYAEMGRCLLASCAGGAGAGFVPGRWPGSSTTRRLARLHHGRSIADAAILFAGGAVWIVVTMWVLDRSGSALPSVTMGRLRLG